MDQQQNQNQGTLVNVKRVRRGTDKSNRETVCLTFGLDKEGNNSADALIEALQAYKGKQINFDIRLDTKQASNGSSFDTAFVIVKEMIPRDAGATYAPKGGGKKAEVTARANEIRNTFNKTK